MAKRDKLIMQMDAAACRVYNLYASFTNRVDKNLLKKNAELVKKGNDACFVMGNGPSLTKEIMERVKGKQTITVNYFHKAYTDFPSTYHIFFDPIWASGDFYEYTKGVKKELKNTKFITQQPLYLKWKEDGFSLQNVYVANPYKAQYRDNIAMDMTKPVTGSMNVLPFAIQCAMYMGYSKIYLLGCDFNWYATKYAHCYKDDSIGQVDIAGDLLRSSLVHYFHYALEKKSKEIGCQIVNLTEGSLIDAYQRGSLDEIKV